MTPLGMPVEPLVYIITAMSEVSGFLRSTATMVDREKRLCDGIVCFVSGDLTSFRHAEHITPITH